MEKKNMNKTGMKDGGNLFPLGVLKSGGKPIPSSEQAVGKKTPLPPIALAPTAAGKGPNYSKKKR